MPTLQEEVLALRARYDEEPSHSDQVTQLALQLFDGLQPWHEMGARCRELLQSAALLHDIGWSQTPDGKGHHKWSASLILEQVWENLKKDEINVVAQTARYHRKSIPKEDHAEFQALSATARKKVMVLGGILRLADALDRTHVSKVKRVEVVISRDGFHVRVQADGTWEEERAMFEMKKDMLELVAGRGVRCEGMT